MKAEMISTLVAIGMVVIGAESPAQDTARKRPSSVSPGLSKQFLGVNSSKAPTRDPKDEGMVRIDIANTDATNRRAAGNISGDFVPISSEVVKPTAEEVAELRGDVDLTPTVTTRGILRGHRLAGLAVATAIRRGASPDLFVIAPLVNRVRILNRAGLPLMEIDDDSDLGEWRVVFLTNLGVKGAPGYCATGLGHPVWGRQWCVYRGFGVGDDARLRWARAVDVSDIVVRRGPESVGLGRNGLIAALGGVAFNRLAMHAITLGLVEPLSGTWLGDASGPNVLSIWSGSRVIAEVVDRDKDGRADLLLVALRPR
jgi:hypothetical protein